jgi:uncharacterized membrane protein
MNRIRRLLRTTIAGGIVFLVPIVVAAIVLGKALSVARKLVDPLAAHLPFESVIGLQMPILLSIVLIVILCFLAGFLAHAAAARRFINKLENDVLSNIPGYEFFKGVAEGVLGTGQESTKQTVLARIEDAWQIAFLMEHMENGHVAVFVPGAPNPRSGSVYFMTEDRIKPMRVPQSSALKCIRRLGVGSNALLHEMSLDTEPTQK